MSRPDRPPSQGPFRHCCFAVPCAARGAGIARAIVGRRRSGLYEVAFRNTVGEVEASKAWRADGIAAYKQAQLPRLDRIDLAIAVEKDQCALREIRRLLGVKERQDLDLLRG